MLLEPQELSQDITFSLSAGGTIPASSVKVANALGQSLVKALMGGQKVPLTVVQRLWRLKDGQGDTTQADELSTTTRLSGPLALIDSMDPLVVGSLLP